MGLMDKIKGMFGQHDEKIEGGIDKAGDVVDDKTGGKYEGQVDKAQDTAKDALDKLSGDDGAK
jgi:MT0933-like antitoxin protein